MVVRIRISLVTTFETRYQNCGNIELKTLKTERINSCQEGRIHRSVQKTILELCICKPTAEKQPLWCFFDKMRFGVVGSHQPYLIHQCLIQTATGHKQLGAISTPHGFVHMSNLFVVRMWTSTPQRQQHHVCKTILISLFAFTAHPKWQLKQEMLSGSLA